MEDMTFFESDLENLISQLTVSEKISLLSETAPAIERLGIAEYHHGNEALHGVVRPGKFTVFPQAIGLASTWNTALIQETAKCISDEARGKHNHLKGATQATAEHGDLYNGLLTFWSPNLNVARDPRWGRTGETYGEDPVLASQMGIAFVKGLQDVTEGRLKAVATPKHFVGNNEEHNRFECNAEILRDQYFEYYLRPFELAVKEGNCAAIMASYNGINGIPCHANHQLLNDILRKRWGFTGYIVSDCGAVSHLWDRHKYASDPEEAASMAINAGIDLECGSCGTILQVFRNYLYKAYENGKVELTRIDDAVRNVLRARFKLGMFDKKTPWDNLGIDKVGCKKHQELALETAEQSIVLLKNDNNILPLAKNTKICVIGNNSEICQLGDYSGIPFNSPITPVEGLRGMFTDVHLVKYKNTRERDFETISATHFLHHQDELENNGLLGNYVMDSKTTKRIDSAIDFEWENMLPDPIITAKEFSITWEGFLVPPVTGEYHFRAIHGECMRCKAIVTINGNVITTDSILLKANQKYSIRLEYVNYSPKPKIILQWKIKPLEVEQHEFADEISAAKACNVVIAFMGLGREDEMEGRDRTNLNLPERQVRLLDEIHKVNKNIVLVLFNGSSFTLGDISKEIPAIIEAWYPGEQNGVALANILSGKISPSGRLPLTFYKDIKALPDFDCYDITKGFTYMYAKDNIDYPFGYGLSYTSFDYSDFELKIDEEWVNIRMNISNVGNMDGYEVVQIYSKFAEDKCKPYRLTAFSKVFLEQGAGTRVDIKFSVSNLTCFDIYSDDLVVRRGEYSFAVAKSSVEIIKEFSAEVSSRNSCTLTER